VLRHETREVGSRVQGREGFQGETGPLEDARQKELVEQAPDQSATNQNVRGEHVKVLVPTNHLMVDLLGAHDEILRLVQESFTNTRIVVRGNEISIGGEQASQVGHLFDEMVAILSQGHKLDIGHVQKSIEMVQEDVHPSEVMRADLLEAADGKQVRARTLGQRRYIEAVRSNTVTFGIGPAGTGKSYLAVACAVAALQRKEVNRIILTRPAVEAGERLGFLPGDLMAKVDPYLRPLYDALFELAGMQAAQRLLERGTVEVAPLAFMRGRTLNSSFVILDEAQNTTPEQMKMFLTRLGFGSKMVVTGDVTQIDVQGGRSGLLGIKKLLAGIQGVGFVELGAKDVVRHRIVAEIVEAYNRASANRS
jgi:phosphate starvation-inducible PhoH-like protein